MLGVEKVLVKMMTGCRIFRPPQRPASQPSTSAAANEPSAPSALAETEVHVIPATGVDNPCFDQPPPYSPHAPEEEAKSEAQAKL